jgi:hypothetical protein
VLGFLVAPEEFRKDRKQKRATTLEREIEIEIEIEIDRGREGGRRDGE